MAGPLLSNSVQVGSNQRKKRDGEEYQVAGTIYTPLEEHKADLTQISHPLDDYSVFLRAVAHI